MLWAPSTEHFEIAATGHRPLENLQLHCGVHSGLLARKGVHAHLKQIAADTAREVMREFMKVLVLDGRWKHENSEWPRTRGHGASLIAGQLLLLDVPAY